MAIRLYDLAGTDPNILFSPFSMRVRMALCHKGLDFEVLPWRFADKKTTDIETVPTLIDGDTRISDSLEIARYLDKKYPDRPRLIDGSTGEATVNLVLALCGTSVFPACVSIAILPALGLVDEASKAYFRESREKMFGKTLEEVSAPDADTGRRNLATALKPFNDALKGSKFLGGDTVSYADFALFGVVKWADIVGNYRSIDEGSQVGKWFLTLENLYGGHAANAPRARDMATRH